jgi:hypothetical protein
MNYTLIGYTENTSYLDRHGDYQTEPGDFEIFLTRDKDELIETWARMSFSGDYESLNLLLNGVPDDQLDEADDIIWHEVDEARSIRQHELFIQKQIRANEEAVRKSAALALKNAQQAEVQRQRDLAALAKLKKKLGVA